MSSNSRRQLEVWLKTIDVKADRCLDIGGSQNPIIGRTKSWEVGDYKILDLPEPHATKRQPDITKDLNEYWPFDHNDPIYADPGVDIIFCIEVAEYLTNPYQALRNIAVLLKPGGILYISFHHIYPIHKPSQLDYLRYTEHGASKLLTDAGFKVEQLIYRAMSQEGQIAYNAFLAAEGMRRDQDYPWHNTTGYLIKAIKRG